MREPVYEMETPTLFTTAQVSQEPQFVDSSTHAQVSPLPSPATSSSSSGELHIYRERHKLINRTNGTTDFVTKILTTMATTGATATAIVHPGATAATITINAAATQLLLG